jgi:NAD(P)-dependent dehydrogenase (short-subunit alcohol dehydrogenase family)
MEDTAYKPAVTFADGIKSIQCRLKLPHCRQGEGTVTSKLPINLEPLLKEFLLSSRTAIFYGNGKQSRIFMELCNRFGKKVECILVSPERTLDFLPCGDFPVYAVNCLPASIKNKKDDYDLIIVMNEKHNHSILSIAREYGFTNIFYCEDWTLQNELLRKFWETKIEDDLKTALLQPVKTVFITGGNRGIGLALCKKFRNELGYKVYMGVRSIEKGNNALVELGNPDNVIPIVMDIEFEESIKQAYQKYLEVKEPDETLGLFINNAAVQFEFMPEEAFPSLYFDVLTLERTYKINTISPLLMTRTFLPSMRAGTRIVILASGSGVFYEPMSDVDIHFAYSTSKAAVLMATKKIAAAVKNRGIYVNACCPGSCKTSMGGQNAENTPEHGAESVVSACFLSDAEPPSGKFYRHGKRVMFDVDPSPFINL